MLKFWKAATYSNLQREKMDKAKTTTFDDTKISIDNIERFLLSDKKKNILAIIVCTTMIQEFGNVVLGAYSGYAGGGEYESGYFSIDIENASHEILDHSEIEDNEDVHIFEQLISVCGSFSEDDDPSSFSKTGLSLLKKGEKHPNGGKVFMDEEFDGDLLSEVSQEWKISLRFDD